MRDITYALRVFRQAPAFTVIALLALALGIGANTAIFSVVSAVLLRPLPFTNPHQIVQLNETFKPAGTGTASFPTLEDWRRQNSSFESMIAYTNTSANLQDVADPVRIAVVAADRGLFRMLGVEPIAGRTFRDDDPPNVVVAGAGFWERRFGRNSSFLGSKINLDGESYTVIGIMPENFQFPFRASFTELWRPLEISPANKSARGNHFLFVSGRLKPGVTIESARNDMGVIAKRLEAEYPANNEGRGVRLTPLADLVTGGVRDSLLILLGAVGLVLLIACANVANLLLARAAGRTKEVAIRSALGASRARLIRQFLVESVLLALGGGLLGLLVAEGGVKLLLRLAATQIPRSWEVGLDSTVFLFLLAVCVVTGLAFGIAPALAASRTDVQNNLREGTGRGTAGRGASLVRDSLVIGEVALAFILLIGAGLLMRTCLYLESRPTGLQTENVLTMRMSISESAYKDAGALSRYLKSIEDRAREVPGVRAAGFIQLLPLQDSGWNGNFVINGHPPVSSSRQPSAEIRYVTPGYFPALGIKLLKGRMFDDRDRPDSQTVILINDILARRYFGDEDPIGKATNRGTVVGVVADVRQVGLDQQPVPECYFPLSQAAIYGLSLVTSTTLPVESATPSILAAIRRENPNQAVFLVKPMQRVVVDSLGNRNLYMSLLAIFAGLALVLSMAGIYGVISYSVTQRTREFGIRMALGAKSANVMTLVLARGSLLVAIGLVVGIGGAIGLTRLLRAVLAGVTATDPTTFAGVALVLGLVALAACAVPAARALKVDPIVALRQE
jgi:predicted permease